MRKAPPSNDFAPVRYKGHARRCSPATVSPLGKKAQGVPSWFEAAEAKRRKNPELRARFY